MNEMSYAKERLNAAKAKKGRLGNPVVRKLRAQGGEVHECSFSDLPGLGATLDAIIAEGDAVHIGVTMDRSAVLVRLFSNGESSSVWCHDQGQLVDVLGWLVDLYNVNRRSAGEALGHVQVPLPSPDAP